jgi:hypothetical protein
VILELIASGALGALLLWLVLGREESGRPDWVAAAGDPVEDTPRGRALLALKELDFDRETGKLAEGDYQALKAQLSREAVRLLDEAPAEAAAPAPVSPARPTCQRCGPRPEPAAHFCSRCGDPIGA